MKNKLRIGIDAQILGKQKGGVELSVEILIRSLAEIDRENEYFLYVTERHPFQENELPGNFHLCRQASSAPLLGRLILLPWYYHRDKLDVIYMQRAATWVGCRVTVLHVHDAMYATHPHLFPGWKRGILNWLFRWSGRKASAVITPTQASCADIVREYGIEAAKIHVIPDTVDTREVYVENDSCKIEAISAEYKLRRPYVIYLGAIERNKNVHGLVDAFAMFGKKHPDYDLALVGKWRSETRGGYTDELVEQIEELGLKDRVKVTGFVSREHKRLLLNGAKMLVFPSETEGLGLPPIEAMACGIPVIAGAVPAIEEYYGDALLSCPHDNTERLAELMCSLAEDEDLVKKMRAKGLERAGRDRWNYKGPLMQKVFYSVSGKGEKT